MRERGENLQAVCRDRKGKKDGHRTDTASDMIDEL